MASPGKLALGTRLRLNCWQIMPTTFSVLAGFAQPNNQGLRPHQRKHNMKQALFAIALGIIGGLVLGMYF
jgi:hypothetical protein